MADLRPGPFLVLTGPTGVGKSSLSLSLAERLGAEIISVDSRAVYRGLDIGTAKPTEADRARVSHHFIDERDPDQPWSAGLFAEAANQRIGDILERGRVPLLVGGSTLYLEALLHGLAATPPADPATRAALMQRVQQPGGATALFETLQAVDPGAARTLDASKTQRLVRALEVYQISGRPWSSYFDDTPAPPYQYHVLVLTRPREALYARLEARVDAMLAAGLVEENRTLLNAGVELDVPPLSTIGYREPIAYLKGYITYDEMVRRLKRNTRRYAKRQLTWFRRHPEYEWIDLDATSEREILKKLYAITENLTPAQTRPGGE